MGSPDKINPKHIKQSSLNTQTQKEKATPGDEDIDTQESDQTKADANRLKLAPTRLCTGIASRICVFCRCSAGQTRLQKYSKVTRDTLKFSFHQ